MKVLENHMPETTRKETRRKQPNTTNKVHSKTYIFRKTQNLESGGRSQRQRRPKPERGRAIETQTNREIS